MAVRITQKESGGVKSDLPSEEEIIKRLKAKNYSDYQIDSYLRGWRAAGRLKSNIDKQHQ